MVTTKKGESRSGGKPRVTKSELITRVVNRGGFKKDHVQEIVEALLDEIIDCTSEGYQVMITGFGSFRVIKKRGHVVQFGEDNSRIDDYSVLKFSASSTLNRRIDEG